MHPAPGLPEEGAEQPGRRTSTFPLGPSDLGLPEEGGEEEDEEEDLASALMQSFG